MLSERERKIILKHLKEGRLGKGPKKPFAEIVFDIVKKDKIHIGIREVAQVWADFNTAKDGEFLEFGRSYRWQHLHDLEKVKETLMGELMSGNLEVANPLLRALKDIREFIPLAVSDEDGKDRTAIDPSLIDSMDLSEAQLTLARYLDH